MRRNPSSNLGRLAVRDAAEPVVDLAATLKVAEPARGRIS